MTEAKRHSTTQSSTNQHKPNVKFWPKNAHSSSTAQPGQKKKSRWRKKKKGGTQTQSAPSRGPVKFYISSCCAVQAIKPRCGKKESVIDPETKKAKETPRGLGHWRCTACKKACKVKIGKPPSTEITAAVATPATTPVEASIATAIAA